MLDFRVQVRVQKPDKSLPQHRSILMILVAPLYAACLPKSFSELCAVVVNRRNMATIQKYRRGTPGSVL